MQTNAASKTVEIFNQDGGVTQYTKLSARIPEFLREFPKSEGYRVTIEASDSMSLKPGILKLYEAALSSGKTPDELGLPKLKCLTSTVFTAKLLKDDKVVETASSLRAIENYKDWEIGETAARQRLLAALGFGGESFDEDESADMADQKLKTNATDEKKVVQLKSAEATESCETDEANNDSKADAKADVKEPSDAESTSETSAEAQEPAPENKPESAEATRAEKQNADVSSDTQISEAVRRQIENLIRIRGLEDKLPLDKLPTTNVEGKRLMKAIMNGEYSQ